MQATARLASLSLEVFPVADIAFLDRGWSRGHATGTLFPPAAPGHLAVGPVLVAALEEIDPGRGFDRHAHHAVETILVPLTGALTHEDSLGGSSVTGPEDVATLRAGRGIEHAEYCIGDVPMRGVMFMLASDPTVEPAFARHTAPRSGRVDRLRVLASGRGAVGAAAMLADVELSAAVLSRGATIEHAVRGTCYVMATDGAVEANGVRCAAGDRIVVTGEGTLRVHAVEATELFVLDC